MALRPRSSCSYSGTHCLRPSPNTPHPRNTAFPLHPRRFHRLSSRFSLLPRPSTPLIPKWCSYWRRDPTHISCFTASSLPTNGHLSADRCISPMAAAPAARAARSPQPPGRRAPPPFVVSTSLVMRKYPFGPLRVSYCFCISLFGVFAVAREGFRNAMFRRQTRHHPPPPDHPDPGGARTTTDHGTRQPRKIDIRNTEYAPRAPATTSSLDSMGLHGSLLTA